MSDLNFDDKMKFEKLFNMSSGYVMDFSNTTFQEFIHSVLRINIYDGKYSFCGNSKANHLRALWKTENNYNVATLNSALLEHWKYLDEINSNSVYYNSDEWNSEYTIFNKCRDICERLKENTINENLNEIKIDADDININLLYEQIKDSISKNLPETALDRLHTFTIKYLKKKADKFNIDYKGKALHSIFGKYIKILDKKNVIESEMAKRILKYSISILEAFNDVRNCKSFAHDNDLLKNNESILILNNIFGLIKFLDFVDQDLKENGKVSENKFEEYDLPF
jgi:hypothetical protein